MIKPEPEDEKSRASSLAGRIGSNSLALILSHTFNTAVGGVVAVLLIRHLGRSEYGLLTTTYAYLSLFQIFTSVGIDTLIHREVARDPKSANMVVSRAAGLRMCLALAGMALSWSCLWTVESQRVASLIVLASLSFAFSFYPFYLVLYQTEMRMARPKLVFGAWAVTLALGKVALIWAGAALEIFVALEVLSAAVIFLLARALGRKSLLRWRVEWAPAHWRTMLAEAWPIAATMALIQVYLRVDQLMLFRMNGAVEVGLYGVAVRLVEFGNILPVVYMGSAFPILSRLWVESGTRHARATELSFRALAWVGFPLAVFLGLYARPILAILLGAEFEPAAPVLRVLSFSLPAAFANSVLYNRLFSSGEQRTAAVLALAGALSNVMLNLVLIPQRGAVGAALATAISYCAIPIIAVLLGPVRSIGIQAVRAHVRPGLAAGATLLGLWASGMGPFWAAAALVVCYPCLLLLTGEIGPSERAVIRTALGWKQ